MRGVAVPYTGGLGALISLVTSLAAAQAQAPPMPPSQVPAHTQAPPDVCRDKLALFLNGDGQDVTGDLDWFAAYCDAATHETALNAVAEATMEASLEDTKQSTKAIGAQIKAMMKEAHGAAASAAAADMLTGMAAAPAGPVVVIGPGPRPLPPPVVVIHAPAPPPPPPPRAGPPPS